MRTHRLACFCSWKVYKFKSTGDLRGQEPQLEDTMLPKDFTLTEWCKENSHTRKTEGILAKEELDAKSISLLDCGEIRESGLPLGQRKLVQRAIAELCNAIPKMNALWIIPHRATLVMGATRGLSLGPALPQAQPHMDISASRDQVQALGLAGKDLDAYLHVLPANAYPGHTHAISIPLPQPSLWRLASAKAIRPCPWRIVTLYHHDGQGQRCQGHSYYQVSQREDQEAHTASQTWYSPWQQAGHSGAKHGWTLPLLQHHN